MVTQRLAIFGSTGSIGMSTLDVAQRHPDRFAIVALAAASNHERLLEQCIRHRPVVAVLEDPRAAQALEAGEVAQPEVRGPQREVALPDSRQRRPVVLPAEEEDAFVGQPVESLLRRAAVGTGLPMRERIRGNRQNLYGRRDRRERVPGRMPAGRVADAHPVVSERLPVRRRCAAGGE